MTVRYLLRCGGDLELGMTIQDDRPAARRRWPALRGMAVAIITYFVIVTFLVVRGGVGIGELLLAVAAALALGIRAAHRAGRPAQR